jgi:soluble lytic murein transglycosylase-like protein
MLNRYVLAGIVCLLSAAPASAQIYAWHDAAGNLVLSEMGESRGSEPTVSYAVPHTEKVRSTRYVSLDRANAYDDLIVDNSRANGLRPDLVRAVIQVESGFNPSARSPKGAMGLMQLMPATAQQFNVANPFNPTENVRAGTAYLRQLLDRYDDNEELALAAYNAGPAAVDRHGEAVPPYHETQQYVSKVSGLAGAAKLPGAEIVRSIDLVGSDRVVHLSNVPASQATRAVRSQEDRAAQMPAQAPPSEPALQTP